VPFRDAHGIVGQIVLYCEEHGKAIEDLTLAELQSFSDKLGEDVYAYIDYDAILRKGNKKEMLNV
jgi:argininosuccinate lyase